VPLHVVVEVALGEEGRVAAGEGALVGSDAGVRPDVSLQVSLLVESFLALGVRALEWFFLFLNIELSPDKILKRLNKRLT